MIKKILYSSLLILSISLVAKTDKSSQTFLFTRPAHQNLGLSKVLWFGVPLNEEQKIGAQVNLHLQKSWKADRIKQYFLPVDRTSARVNNTATDKDVLPKWLGLPDAFNGNVTFAPEQKQYGATFELRRIIGPLFGMDFFKDWWVQLTVAAAHVENNLNISQDNVQNAAASTLNVYDIVTAFNNPDWNYLKVDGKQEKTSLSEVRFAIGSTFVSNGRVHASSYSAISLPGSGKTSNVHMFDSQVGFNKHVGIIWGLNMQAPLTREDKKCLVTFNINLESNFLIRNHQYRTFDLNDNAGLAVTVKPAANSRDWSRYLLMRNKNETGVTGTATVPGVNVLTHYVRVSPHAIVDLSTSLRATRGNLQGEIGYGLWAHGGDAVKITDAKKWVEEYQIAGDTAGNWAKDATIKNKGIENTTFTPIRATDLNMLSGSMLPSAVHRLHTYVNLQSKKSKNNMHTGIGGFVEIPRNETKALATYGLWLNAGGSF
jgi:hypothetical protein